MIEARHVSVRRGGREVLSDVSVAVPAGEVVAIVGSNGAGKTTLLRALSGDAPPDSGEVFFGGRPLADQRPSSLARVRAVLPQESGLAFGFRVIEVVLLGRTPHPGGGDAPVDLQAAAESMTAAGIAPLAERLYPTLSGGERQKTHLARVLAQIWRPRGGGRRCLLLDEPTASLDLRSQHEVLALARTLARDGAAVVAVLHDLNLAAAYADRMVLLEGGRAVAQGAPAEVLTPENVWRTFGIRALVMPHPKTSAPLVVPLAQET